MKRGSLLILSFPFWTSPEDPGSIPGGGRSPGEGKGYLLQYYGLENSMGSQRVGHY